MRRGAILLHVVNHATYHRGWVADLFFRVPAKNPTTDRHSLGWFQPAAGETPSKQ